MAKERNLPSKTTLTTSDYIRVVGSDNASYKQLVSDVAQKIIEDYTGSSLAGSSQSVKSALDALNSKGTWRELLGSKTEDGNYTLNDSYAEYRSVVVMLFGSDNSIASCIYPTTMLITAGYRPVIEVYSNKAEIIFTSSTSVTVSGLIGSVRIYGIR